MSDQQRRCATCVFWNGRGDGEEAAARGRCRARLLDQPDPRQAMMTQADFVCPQWCGAEAGRDAAA